MQFYIKSREAGYLKCGRQKRLLQQSKKEQGRQIKDVQRGRKKDGYISGEQGKDKHKTRRESELAYVEGFKSNRHKDHEIKSFVLGEEKQ